MSEAEVKTGFPPVVGEDPAVLLLGSLPGDESLRRLQYYAYAHNAFWRIMGSLFDFDGGGDYAERLVALRRNRIALWDVLAAANRPGSLDTAIRDGVANPIDAFVAAHPTVRAIGCNGTAAYNLLRRHHRELFAAPRLSVRRLPSTSPAAAIYTFQEKLQAYRDFFREIALID